MRLENYSKGLLLFSGLMLILIGVPRLLLNAWLPYSEYLFLVALILFLAAGAFSYKLILDIFSMRTTKYGLNMGTLIGLGFLLYICVNFMAFRYDKSVDVTREKLNSLSLQSLELLDALKEPVEFKVYYQGKAHAQLNMGLRLLFKKYKRESSKIKTNFVDAHKDPASGAVLKREDKGKLAVFVKKGTKTERVREPIGEESLTSALFRINQNEAKKLYFLTGHGERPLVPNNSPGESIKFLADALNDKGFEVKALSLSDKLSVPKDAALVAVVGPRKALLDKEVFALKNYLKEGGRLLLTADPTYPQKTVRELSSLVGVEIEENFLLSTQTVAGGDSLSVLGRDFDKNHEITSVLDENAITLYYESGSLKGLKKGYQVKNLVKTLHVVIPVNDLQNYQVEVQGKRPESASVMMLSEGEFAGASHDGHNHGEEEDQSFKAVIVADSDFLSDVYFETGFNKDLALNTFAYLTGQDKLISIRPRLAKNTKLIMTTSNSAFVLIFPVLIPLLLLICSVVLWFRGRGA